MTEQHFTALELEARALLAKVTPVTDEEVMLKQVMTAMWSASMDLDRMNRIAEAMNGFRVVNLEAAVKSFMKQKVMRRSTSSRHRFELNY